MDRVLIHLLFQADEIRFEEAMKIFGWWLYTSNKIKPLRRFPQASRFQTFPMVRCYVEWYFKAGTPVVNEIVCNLWTVVEQIG